LVGLNSTSLGEKRGVYGVEEKGAVYKFLGGIAATDVVVWPADVFQCATWNVARLAPIRQIRQVWPTSADGEGNAPPQICTATSVARASEAVATSRAFPVPCVLGAQLESALVQRCFFVQGAQRLHEMATA
jgi:hypothetical protein